MRRMYSKEQLQKLIDEVSRLIAIEEIDKVVPVPSLDKAGFSMVVNAAGTGYELKESVISVDGLDIAPKTVAQTNYNYDSGNITIGSPWLNGLTAHNSFVKILEINKVLYVIISATLENETENDITTGTYTPIISKYINSTIAAKIYRKDGSACNINAQSGADQILVHPISFAKDNGTDFKQIGGLVYSGQANQLAVWLSAGESITIPAGEKRFIDFRLALVL